MDKKQIAICIATYKRPGLLRKLITSIFGQSVPTPFPFMASVIVCDNDESLSAQDVCDECSQMERPWWMNGFRYLGCREKGLVNVRNFLVEAALEEDADFVLFVDDDEYVCGTWLHAMMQSYESTHADVVFGPVLAYFENEPEKTLAKHFDRPVPQEGSPCGTLMTGNTLISASVFRERNFRFDSRFNLTGGEDTYLGYMIERSGGRMINSSKAVAYEYIPASRLNISWIMTRNARGASTWLTIRMAENKAKYIAYAMMKIVALSLAAVAKSPLLLTGHRDKYDSLIYVAKCQGTVKGLHGKAVQEYE